MKYYIYHAPFHNRLLPRGLDDYSTMVIRLLLGGTPFTIFVWRRGQLWRHDIFVKPHAHLPYRRELYDPPIPDVECGLPVKHARRLTPSEIETLRLECELAGLEFPE